MLLLIVRWYVARSGVLFRWKTTFRRIHTTISWPSTRECAREQAPSLNRASSCLATTPTQASDDSSTASERLKHINSFFLHSLELSYPTSLANLSGRQSLTLYGHIKTANNGQQYGDWYTGRWWMGCYIWCSEEGPGRGAAPQSPRRCTKCNNPPINGQCTNFVSFDVAL